MLHLAQDSFTSLLQADNFFPVLVVFGGLGVGLIITISLIIAGILRTRAREETKREIAAYVAEGSIDADTAVALLRADDDVDKCVGAVAAVIGNPGKSPRPATA